jgi:hypothetical protein
MFTDKWTGRQEKTSVVSVSSVVKHPRESAEAVDLKVV